MKLLCAVLLLACVPLGQGAELEDAKPLTPEEALKKVGKKVLVQMQVKASKNALEKRKEIYLDSEEDFRDPKNLAVVITEAGAMKFKDAKIDDPAVYFKGKTIRVTGTVATQNDRPRIVVDEPKQIVAVEAK